MSATAVQTVNYNGQAYVAVPNPSLTNKDGSPKSALDHFVDFTDKTNGAFRCLQLIDRVTRLSGEVLKSMGHAAAGYCKELSGRLSAGWGVLVLTRVIPVTRNAHKALVSWIGFGPTNAMPLGLGRDTAQKIHDVAEAAAVWGYFGSFITLGNATLKNVAECFDLVSNVTDLGMAGQDYSWAAAGLNNIKLQPGETGDVQKMFVEKKREALIKIAKAVVSLFSGVIGLVALALGGPILPTAALIALAFTGTSFAVAAHFHKETTAHPMLSSSKVRNAALLATVV